MDRRAAVEPTSAGAMLAITTRWGDPPSDSMRWRLTGRAIRRLAPMTVANVVVCDASARGT